MLIVHGDESNGRTDPMDIDGRKDPNITGNKQKNNKHAACKSSKPTNIFPTFILALCAFGAIFRIPMHCGAFFKQHVPCWTEEREVSSGSNGQWTNDWIRTQTFIAISMPVNGHCTITYKSTGVGCGGLWDLKIITRMFFFRDRNPRLSYLQQAVLVRHVF